jgi:hypothetical protein
MPIKSSTHAALVISNKFGLNMETVRRDFPPDEIEIGVNSLLISAGKERPCARVPLGKIKDKIITNKNNILRGFFIYDPF